MTRVMQWFTATDKGTMRKANEDSVQCYPMPEDLLHNPSCVPPGGRLCIVADGMGGHRGGQEASRTAVQRIAQFYYNQKDMLPDQALHDAIIQTGQDVLAIGQSEPSLNQMGTTVVLVASLQGTAYVANVGDSRAYLLRAGKLEQLSEDDSWVQQQVQMHTLTPDQARTHHQRNLLVQYLGSQYKLTPHMRTIALQEGDVFLLCTDGVYDVVSQEDMIAHLSVPPAHLAKAPRQLVERALLNGTNDNVTVAVGYYGPPPREPAPLAKPMLPHAPPETGRRFWIRWALLAGLTLLLLSGVAAFMLISMGSSLFGFGAAPDPTNSVPTTSATPADFEEANATGPISAPATHTDNPNVDTPSSASPISASVTLDMPLFRVQPAAQAAQDEADRPTCEGDSGLLLRRDATEAPLTLTVNGDSYSIGANARWHSECLTTPDDPITITISADEANSTDTNITLPKDSEVYQIEYIAAPIVTLFGANDTNDDALSEQEKTALRGCGPLSSGQDGDALVVLSGAENVTGSGADNEPYDFELTDGAQCFAIAETVNEFETDGTDTRVSVALEPAQYYVVRLSGN